MEGRLMIRGQHQRFPRLVTDEVRALPAWSPEPIPQRMPWHRAAFAIVVTLLASWCMAVGLIWSACKLTGVC